MKKLRAILVKVLLRLLNTHFLNPTPCRYDFVGNLDNFSRSDMEGTLAAEPDISLRRYLESADRFKACPISKVGISVVEGDGSYSLNRRFD
jgi:hypothetical protein